MSGLIVTPTLIGRFSPLAAVSAVRKAAGRLRKALLLSLAFGAATVAATAQTTTAFPGSTAVGGVSQPLSVTIPITASGLSIGPIALTQGVPLMDFALAPGGTCALNLAYSAGTQCTVNVVFAPRYPGQRSGAVVLRSTLTGQTLGSTLLTASATGSLPVLVPGRIDTVAGDGAWIFHGDGVLAINAPIFLPTGVVTDPAGNLFLSDQSNNRVRRVEALTGIITTVAGNGTPGYSGDNGPAVLAEISAPAGLALDGAGNLYFADTGNHAIRKIDGGTGVITTVAGVPQVQGYTGDSGLASAARLSLPEGLALDTAGDLYVADTGNNVIRKVDTAGYITTVAGTGAAGYNGDSQLATGAQLNAPWNLTVAADGSLVIADLSNNRVRKVSPSGMISTLAGDGTRAFSGDNAAAASAELNAPAAAIFDPAGNLYIADSGNNRVRKINEQTGLITTISGTDSSEFAGDTGPAPAASLYGPYSLFFDQTGSLFVADMFHNRVRKINANAIALPFPTMRVGKVSAPQIEGLENDGNADLNLTLPLLLNAALDPATTTCSIHTAVSSDNTCNLGVEFAPLVLGDLVLGSVTVNSNGGNSPNIISLSGQVLSVEPTSVSLTSSQNPSLVGAPVTFTATVTSDDPNRAGNVVFLDGSTQLCSVALPASGAATCTTSTLALGQHSITANYAGDANNASSLSAALTQVVKQTSSLVLSAAPNPAIVTQNVTLTLTATAPTGTPTGAIVFYDGTTALGTVNLNASGIATFSTTALSAATHNLTASYAGDAADAAGTSNAVSEVVQQATTATTIATSNANATVGSAVTFSAAVSAVSGPAPTGTVAFADGGVSLGSSPLDANGNAALPVATLAPGAHHIVATYSGDSDDATSSSAALLETIQQIATTTALTSDANPANAGTTLHLHATVAMAAGATADGAITGQVTFYDGATVLGVSTVDATGNAVLTSASLAVATHMLTATYAGNTDYAASTSAALSQVVVQSTTTTTLSASSTATLAGKSVIFTATVAGGSPTGSVTFFDGALNLGKVTLSAQETASLTLSTLLIGSHNVTAVYSGDPNYTTSTSASLLETISLAVSAVTLTGPSAPVDAGVAVQLTGILSSNGVTPTGALTLRDGAAAVATLNASATGTYAFNPANLAIGVHVLTVAYAGDADNAAAVSNTLTITVQQAPTSTALALSANPVIVGQPITLNAAVTSDSPGATGSVTFFDGATALASLPLNVTGGASYTTSTLAFGPHMLTAVYSGDTNHALSTSTAVTARIVQAASAVLTSNSNPSNAGANLVFTAKLAAVAGYVPTGSVTFLDGATTLGLVTLDATGAATLPASALAVGSHTITVKYAGDNNFASTSASLIQTVQSASTHIALTASANPATYGAALTLTAVITTDGGIATGTVTFAEGSTVVGTATLDATGTANLSTSTLAPGLHNLVANYAGDGKASAGSSTPLALTVKQLTTIALTSSANPAQTLAPITLTAAVANHGSTPATGTITFTDGSVLLGNATLDATGTASLIVPALLSGNHSLTASYAGDAVDFASASSVLTQGITLRPTTTALTATLTNPGNSLQATLIAIVRWIGTTTPSGVVTFVSAGNVLGSAQLDATGIATLTVQLPSAGESITASYAGDASYASSDSAASTITGGAATQFTLALSPATVSLQSKQHITVNLTMASVKGFTDTLQFGCLGLPYAATCTFSSAQMKLAADGSGSVQLMLDTGDPLGAGEQVSSLGRRSSGPLLAFLPLGLLSGLAFYRFRRRAALRSLPALLLAVCALLAVQGLTGCAGLQTSGTPAGTYTFKVTASGSGTGITQSQVMTMTVTQ